MGDEFDLSRFYSPGHAAMSPGMVERGNIDIMHRPVVKNADGTTSTVRSMSFSEGGPEILVPTVAHDGSRILSEDEAIDQYRKSGLHLGKFKTPDAATAYAQILHEQQARDHIGAPMADKKKSSRKYTEGEVEGTRDLIDPKRDARVKDIRDRLSAGDDGGPINLDGGASNFYNEVSPVDVKRGWEEEARFPGPPKPGERFDQGKPRAMTIDPRDTAQPAPESGGLIEAILHGLGLRGRK